MILFETPNSSSARAKARGGAASPSTRRGRAALRQLIGEPLFHEAIDRERKRADRFEDSFAVVLITLDRRQLAAATIDQLTRTLANMHHAADVIGWFEQDRTIGLLRSASGADPLGAATTLITSVRRVVAKALPKGQASGCAVVCDTYSAGAGATHLSVPTGKAAAAKRLAKYAAKRTLDVAGSTALLMALGPVFLCVAAAVKLTSRGPVFFRQQRVGEAGQPFTMFKFRTMQVNADPRIHQEYVEKFIKSNHAAAAGNGAVFKLVNDPRVTLVGDFLRRSSLDELPQFWNVLRGDMSLVGPRPPLPYEVAQYKQWHRRRVLEAKPGITGLWQVTGRSRTTFDEMVRLDLRYARSHSVWTDLNILLATPKAVLSGKGAR
jgi:lipopolysaccharide/colanic/teichoic acid biosynthesis glycosyltransferase